MKRLHIHVSVDDLSKSINFYSTLFGCEPAKRKDDYAKWMLDDHKVNFAISARGVKIGIDNLFKWLQFGYTGIKGTVSTYLKPFI